MRLKLSPDPLVRMAWAFGVATLVLFVLLLGRPSFTNASKPPNGWDPQIAMQFVRSVSDVELILGEAPSPDREVMRFKIYLDYVFIPAYAGFLVTLSLLAARGRGWSRIAGYAAGICAAGAAAFDVAENRAILEVVDTSLRVTTPGMIQAIARASTAKWILAAAALFLLLTHYLRQRFSKS